MKNKFYLLSGLSAALLSASSVYAAEVDTNMAQMQAMDKITGKVNVIEVPVGGEVKFGSFSVVVRSCKTNSEDEIPENFAFVDVTDKSFDKDEFNIFKGWMFSSSPAVNAVEHPIYDVWLLKCFNGEPKPEQLLSEEALAARDNLPRLADVREQQKQLQENSFAKAEPEENNTIEFKDSMYKEEKPAETAKPAEPQKVEGEPENLLNIKDSYETPAEETVTVPAEELSKALEAEEQSLKEKAAETAPQEEVKAETASVEDFDTDDLSAAIDAELAKQKE
jgi:hypothetical protein